MSAKRGKAEPPWNARSLLAELKRLGSPAGRASLVRFGIDTPKAHGVSMAQLQALARQIGRQHALAGKLWQSGWHEARCLAALVADPEQVTPLQMDRWCRGFDNWGICDTVCFCLWDRTPHAWRKIAQWAGRSGEFQKRAAFALLASVALHDKAAADAAFRRCLPLIERASDDGRNFVKKGVSWALRAIGRRNRALHAECLALARELAASSAPAARWIGKDAVRDLQGAAAKKHLARVR